MYEGLKRVCVQTLKRDSSVSQQFFISDEPRVSDNHLVLCTDKSLTADRPLLSEISHYVEGCCRTVRDSRTETCIVST